MENKLLTTKDVAEYFGVNTTIVTQNFCRNGLKFIKISQTDFRYNMKDVLEFEESLKETRVPNKMVYDLLISNKVKTNNVNNRCKLRV